MTDVTTEVPDVPRAKRYEMVKMGPSGTFRMATEAWAERMRYLYKLHVKPVDPATGWKGPCFAHVPFELAADVRDAMGFMGSHVDGEAPVGDEKHVELRSEGYYFHIGA